MQKYRMQWLNFINQYAVYILKNTKNKKRNRFVLCQKNTYSEANARVDFYGQAHYPPNKYKS